MYIERIETYIGVRSMYKVFTTIFVLMLTGCGASTPLKEFRYTNNLPLYPSVAETLSVRNSGLEAINVYTDSFKSKYIYAKDIFVPIRFKLETNIENGKIVTKAVDIASESTNTDLQGNYIWSEQHGPGFLSFDINKYINVYNEEIVFHMSHNYLQLKDRKLDDISFNLTVIRGLTDIAAERWHNENMIGRAYQFSLPLDNFKNNKNTDIAKKYHATFNLKSWDRNQFMINLYTNNKRLANYKKGTTVSFKATPLKLERGFSLLIENGLTLAEVE